MLYPLAAALTIANGQTKTVADFVYDGAAATVASLTTKEINRIILVNRGNGTVKLGGLLGTPTFELRPNDVYATEIANAAALKILNDSGLDVPMQALLEGEFAQ